MIHPPAKTRECPVPGCSVRLAGRPAMCRHHWHQVKAPLRGEILRRVDTARLDATIAAEYRELLAQALREVYAAEKQQRIDAAYAFQEQGRRARRQRPASTSDCRVVPHTDQNAAPPAPEELEAAEAEVHRERPQRGWDC